MLIWPITGDRNNKGLASKKTREIQTQNKTTNTIARKDGKNSAFPQGGDTMYTEESLAQSWDLLAGRTQSQLTEYRGDILVPCWGNLEICPLELGGNPNSEILGKAVHWIVLLLRHFTTKLPKTKWWGKLHCYVLIVYFRDWFWRNYKKKLIMRYW